MVHIRPPAEDAAPPVSSANQPSIEIGAAALASFEIAEPVPVEPVASPATPEMSAGTSSFLFWCVGGTALFIVFGAMAVMWLGGQSDTTPPIVPVETPVATNEEPIQRAGDSLPVSSDAAASPSQPADPLEAVTTEAVATAADTHDEIPSTPSTPELPPSETDQAAITEPAAAAGESEQVAAATPELPPALPPKPDEPVQKPVMKFDPLDFDPSQFSLAASEPTTATEEAVTDADSDADRPDAIIEQGADDGIEKQPPAPVVAPSLTMRLGPAPESAARPNRLAEQLSTTLPAFAVKDMPLCRFAETISDLADVPITLDPVELELAGTSPQQPVSADGTDVTLEKLLKDALAAQRLELAEDGGNLAATLTGGDTRKTVVYDVADLTRGADADQLAANIQRFVSPESWTSAGGSEKIDVDGTKLRLDATQRVRHAVLIFCERLRLARELPQRSRYPANLLSGHSPYTTITPQLAKRTTFTFLPWTRFANVIRHWQKTSELTILVDWAALADIELRPTSPVACSANDRTWETVFDQSLEQLGLGWWVAGTDTIQITTRDRMNDVHRAEFYAIAKPLRDQFSSTAALIDALQQEWQAAADQQETEPQAVVMVMDEPSERLIIMGPPNAHRFFASRFSAE